ncbi:MAG: glycosyltransferase [Solirubrobacterales bacterium]
MEPAEKARPGAVRPQRTGWRRFRPPLADELSPDMRAILPFVFGAVWTAFSIWLAIPWAENLSTLVGTPLAWLTIGGIAIGPGVINSVLLSSLLLERMPPAPPEPPGGALPAVTVMVAAFNEAEHICETVTSILESDYPGEVKVIVADDGSRDRTACCAEEMGRDEVTILRLEHGGKARALNSALEACGTELCATVDGDTQLGPLSLQALVRRHVADGASATAGSVLSANPKENLLTRMQAWDYYLGIAAVKRGQNYLGNALVAQGSFSCYQTEDVRVARGWPKVSGEDIVLTWALITEGGKIAYEPSALAFTHTPSTFRGFYRQRSRWARGMVQGLNRHGAGMLLRGRAFIYSVLVDYVLPWIDFALIVVMVPGVILALTGRFYVISWLTFAVLLLNFAILRFMAWKEDGVWDRAGLPRYRDPIGLFIYAVSFQAFVAPASLLGYWQAITRRKDRW